MSLTSKQITLYVLSPYRLATVVGGIGVAFLFTYFPSVVTVKNCFRRDLASFQYLLAYYYNSMYTTHSISVNGLAGDHSEKRSLGVSLKKLALVYLRRKSFSCREWNNTWGSWPGNLR